MSDNLRLLYDQHSDALYAFLKQLVREESDVKDLFQEVFVKIARDPDKILGMKNPRSYLFRLSHNQFLDLVRRRGSRQRREENYALEHSSLFSSKENPKQEAFAREAAKVLETLPTEQRMVIHLKIWEEKTFVEIAEILGISPNTAASRYRYGIDKLESALRSPLVD